MNAKNTKELRIDPRTELILLVLSNVVAFTNQTMLVGILWVTALAVLLVCCGCSKAAVKFIAVFAILLCMQYYMFPIAPKFFVTTFSIFVNYLRKTFPCLMVGTLIIKKTSLRELILAMRKCHIPQKIIIPISVTLRYFPAIREEVRHIRDAMKLRKIPTLQKLECMIVPLMISATITAEELSASAVTRGIENPAKKTSTITLRFRLPDVVCIIGSFAFLVVSIMIL